MRTKLAIGIVLAILMVASIWVATKPTNEQLITRAIDEAIAQMLSDELWSNQKFYGRPDGTDMYFVDGGFPDFYTPRVRGYTFHKLTMDDLRDRSGGTRPTMALNAIGNGGGMDIPIMSKWKTGKLAPDHLFLIMWNSGGADSDEPSPIGGTYYEFRLKRGWFGQKVELVWLKS